MGDIAFEGVAYQEELVGPLGCAAGEECTELAVACVGGGAYAHLAGFFINKSPFIHYIVSEVFGGHSPG